MTVFASRVRPSASVRANKRQRPPPYTSLGPEKWARIPRGDGPTPKTTGKKYSSEKSALTKPVVFCYLSCLTNCHLYCLTLEFSAISLAIGSLSSKHSLGHTTIPHSNIHTDSYPQSHWPSNLILTLTYTTWWSDTHLKLYTILQRIVLLRLCNCPYNSFAALLFVSLLFCLMYISVEETFFFYRVLRT